MSELTWVERHLDTKLSNFQKKAVEILCSAMNKGPWNLRVNWRNTDWNWGDGVRFKLRHHSLSTYDFDELTRLVILAHDECVRIEINALAPKIMAISMWQRNKRDGSMFERHPTIDGAIAKIRSPIG